MKITKIFNNNLVATITSEKREALISGTGIGFGKKVGDQVDTNKITKYYYVENQRKRQLYQMMETTPVEYLELAEAILEKATVKLQKPISESILAGLVDHLHMAVMRANQGKVMPNLIDMETRVMYPKEYEVGKWAVRYVKSRLGVKLPVDEAGYIAIHIQNAEDETSDDVSDMLMFVKEVSDILEEVFSLTLAYECVDYQRLTSHLKFFYQRMMHLQKTSIGQVEDMYQLLLNKHEQMTHCMKRLVALLKQDYAYDVSLSEQVYLMMHILKLLQTE